jgi:hypothetical protein
MRLLELSTAGQLNKENKESGNENDPSPVPRSSRAFAFESSGSQSSHEPGSINSSDSPVIGSVNVINGGMAALRTMDNETISSSPTVGGMTESLTVRARDPSDDAITINTNDPNNLATMSPVNDSQSEAMTPTPPPPVKSATGEPDATHNRFAEVRPQSAILRARSIAGSNTPLRGSSRRSQATTSRADVLAAQAAAEAASASTSLTSNTTPHNIDDSNGGNTSTEISTASLISSSSTATPSSIVEDAALIQQRKMRRVAAQAQAQAKAEADKMLQKYGNHNVTYHIHRYHISR